MIELLQDTPHVSLSTRAGGKNPVPENRERVGNTSRDIGDRRPTLALKVRTVEIQVSRENPAQ
jgi:hypothetical protein